MSGDSAIGVREPRRLRRSEDGILGGVASGIAEYVDVDPVVVRLVFACLALAGGSGAIAYVLLWACVPPPGSDRSPVETLLTRAAGAPGWVQGYLAIVLGLLVLDGIVSDGSGLVIGLGLIGLGVVLFRRDAVSADAAPAAGGTAVAGDPSGVPPSAAQGPLWAAAPAPASAPAVPAEPAWPTPAVPGGRAAWPPAQAEGGAGQAWPVAGGTGRRAAWPGSGSPGDRPGSGASAAGWPGLAASGAGWPVAARPDGRGGAGAGRGSSLLGRATFGLIVLALGAAALADLAGIVALSATRALAVALSVVGIGLVIGTWWGRSRGLLALGLVLLGALTGLALADVVDEAGVGVRVERPAALDEVRDEYALLAGLSVLDLSAVEFGRTPTAVTANVGVGRLEVIVPADVTVDIEGHVRAGDLLVPGEYLAGANLQVDAVGEGGRDGGRLALDVGAGMGSVVVRRADAEGALP